MNDASVITSRLDLLLRLIDTTTGRGVTERDVRFYEDGGMVRSYARGSGNHVFLNCGRRDRDLLVRVYGYDDCRVQVRYEDPDEPLPVREVYLMPSENTARGQPVITFSGRLSGLESIQAVDLQSTGCSINGFDERRRIMTLFRKYQVDLEDIHYGLIHPENGTFEYFEVQKKVSDDSVRIAEPLKQPFATNSPISRIIFGKVEDDGSFCIRVRDSSDSLPFMLRYIVDGEERFQTVDFHHLENTTLK